MDIVPGEPGRLKPGADYKLLLPLELRCILTGGFQKNDGVGLRL
jgi:hypothetical protein